MDHLRILGWTGEDEDQPVRYSPPKNEAPYDHLGFMVDDVVLAKYSNFPHWPAIVIDYSSRATPFEIRQLADPTAVRQKKVLVQFFDDKGDFAWVLPRNLKIMDLASCLVAIEGKKFGQASAIGLAYERARRILWTTEQERKCKKTAQSRVQFHSEQVDVKPDVSKIKIAPVYLSPASTERKRKHRPPPPQESFEVEMEGESDDDAPILPAPKRVKTPSHYSPGAFSVPSTPTSASKCPSSSASATPSRQLSVADEIDLLLRKHGDCWGNTAIGLEKSGFKRYSSLFWLQPKEWPAFLSRVDDTLIKPLAKERLAELMAGLHRPHFTLKVGARPLTPGPSTPQNRIAQALNAHLDGFGDDVAAALIGLGFETVKHLKYLDKFQKETTFLNNAPALTPLAVHLLSTRAKIFSA